MTLTLTLMGDVMPGGVFSERAGELLPMALPPGLRDRLAADVVLANLECPASDRGAPIPNKILHHALPESIQVLRELGVDAVNLANNHMFDYGVEGFEDTVALLDDLGVGYFGAGRDLAEASRPWVTEAPGGRIAAIGFSWTTEWVQQVAAATASSPGVNPADPSHILRSIEEVRSAHRPDVLVVSLHWGEGMSRYPRPDQVALARRIVDAGATLVMGHHPHCLQPMELFGEGAIFYSLGNLLASPSRRTPDNRLTYGDGTLRLRPRRQRLTAAARVTVSGPGKLTVDHVPLVQRAEVPVLREADQGEAAGIRRALIGSDRLLRSPSYARRYAFVRRWDELRSKAEEVREFGLKDLSWRTPFRVVRRLVTGRNMH